MRDARKFFLAHSGAGKQQIGDVGADDEQDKNADAHENAQGADEQALGAMRRLPERQQRGGHAFADVGVGDGHAVGEGLGFSARLLEGDAWLQARDAEHVAVVAVAEHPLFDAVERGLLHVGNPEIEGGDRNGAVKRGCGDADDGELVLIDLDGAADDGGVGVEVRAPETIADDDDGKFAGGVSEFRGQKEAAEFGLDAENGEEISGDELAPYAFSVLFTADAEGGGVRDGDAVKKLEAIAKVNEVRVGVRDPLAVRGDGFKDHEAVGIGDAAEGLEQNRVDPGESGGGGADADGKRQHGHGRECGIAGHHAQAVAEVVEQIFQPEEGAALAMGLAGLLGAPKVDEGLAASFLGREPGTDAGLGIEGDVGFQLGGEVALHAAE